MKVINTLCWSRICKRRGILPVILWLFSMNLFLSNQITHWYCSTNQNQVLVSLLVLFLHMKVNRASLLVCLRCNQFGALKSELVSCLSVYETKRRSQVTKWKKNSSPFTNPWCWCLELVEYSKLKSTGSRFFCKRQSSALQYHCTCTDRGKLIIYMNEQSSGAHHS